MDKLYGKRIIKMRRKSWCGNTSGIAQSNSKNLSYWKKPGYDDIQGFWT